MTRRMLLVALGALAALAVSMSSGGTDRPASSVAAVKGCHGHVATVDVSEGRYPSIAAHIRSAQAKGQPRVMVVNRPGAKQRRDRLLKWWQARHPQPKGDGLDLDEQAPAMARATWKADVRPVPQGENRSQGASMGGQLRGVPDGSCFRWRFTR